MRFQVIRTFLPADKAALLVLDSVVSFMSSTFIGNFNSERIIFKCQREVIFKSKCLSESISLY